MGFHRAAEFVSAGVLGIDVNQRYAKLPPNLEARAREVLEPADIYLEDEPSVADWFRGLVPTRSGAVQYAKDLFPSASWARRYTWRWLTGDLIAGVTVGLVVVPQALAYAYLARLPPTYGLYTSFAGAAVYWVFGTSKDILIGTTAVGSLLVGQVVTRVIDGLPGENRSQDAARTLSLMTGILLLFFGLFKLGWIIEFIPYIPISAFVTAASITIMSTQVPAALGIPDINTREAPYSVIANALRRLSEAHLDAAVGISSIVLLFVVKNFCTMMEARRPAQRRLWTFVSSLRMTFTMLLFTLISYLVNRNSADNGKFRIVGPIQQGFQMAGVPHIDAVLLRAVLPEMPAVAIILVIEHIAIAKAMGRLYNYTINPSQEVVALGMANIFSPFIGGYVCTGSFGASAVLSKAGSRSPLAGLFGALLLILALYGLTGVFFFIPKAALAGLIIHAVFNLLTPPKALYAYWQLSPVELFIWATSLVLAIFISLEASIYAGVVLSVLLLLVRTARTSGHFLGLVRVKRVGGGRGPGPDGKDSGPESTGRCACRDVFLPLDRRDASNPHIKVVSPYPGVFVYRLSEGFNYLNQAYHMDALAKHVLEHTRRMSEEHLEKESDRLWNDPGPRDYKCDPEALPYLRAIVFDFGAVNNVDITSVQGLVDLRDTFHRYSSPDTVDFHFASIHNRWTRRALAAAGFGYPIAQNPVAVSNWKPAYVIAGTLFEREKTGTCDGRRVAVTDADDERTIGSATPDSSREAGMRNLRGSSTGGGKLAAVYGVDRPFFHVDLIDAVESAVRNARSKGCRSDMRPIEHL